MGPVLAGTGDPGIEVESDSAGELRFIVLTRVPSEDVRERGGPRAKETDFCRVSESGRLSIDGVVTD